MTSLEGKQLGIVSLRKTLERAEEAGVDLVETSLNTGPSVCRIMDYSRFLYEKGRSSKERGRKQEAIQVKEIKLHPGTDEGDCQVRFRSPIYFLKESDKAKITLRFYGRKATHQQIGTEVLSRVEDDL